MSGNSTRWAIAVVASLLVLLALPVLSAPAAAAPATPMAPSASVSAASQWAYGGQQWTNVTVTTNNVTYQLSAYFGWAVVFTQTNTSATTVMLEAQRTMGAHLDASLCAPNCQNPVLNGSVHMKGYEQQTAFANFTLLGTVYVNGSATAALGLINTSAYVRGALNESYFVTLTNHTFSATASAALHVTEHASASVAFTPALGLVPFNLTRGETWNSSASYVASGLWAAAFSWTKTSFLGVTTTGSGNPSGTANATGTLQLYGQDFGTVTLKNGQTVPVIGIAIVGPF
ncbi:MAG TPA: hypothetical protein VJS68_01110, partial [Thermoplasmata archaeon]|nr:hypothetical protein [Thermoplasmata archaeon]